MTGGPYDLILYFIHIYNNNRKMKVSAFSEKYFNRFIEIKQSIGTSCTRNSLSSHLQQDSLNKFRNFI